MSITDEIKNGMETYNLRYEARSKASDAMNALNAYARSRNDAYSEMADKLAKEILNWLGQDATKIK